jgi:hypothetical protein
MSSHWSGTTNHWPSDSRARHVPITVPANICSCRCPAHARTDERTPLSAVAQVTWAAISQTHPVDTSDRRRGTGSVVSVRSGDASLPLIAAVAVPWVLSSTGTTATKQRSATVLSAGTTSATSRTLKVCVVLYGIGRRIRSGGCRRGAGRMKATAPALLNALSCRAPRVIRRDRSRGTRRRLESRTRCRPGEQELSSRAGATHV